MPMMPCIGVRISWLIIERKSLLTWADLSASSRACAWAAAAYFCEVMSWTVPS